MPLPDVVARWRTPGWCAATGFALIAGALFVERPGQGYLVAAAVATAFMLLSALLHSARERRWPLVAAILASAFVVLANGVSSRLSELESNWPAVSARLTAAASETMMAALNATAAETRARAERALLAPADPVAAFEFAGEEASASPERSTILYRTGQNAVWGGVFRVEPDQLPQAALGVAFTEFFVVLHASAWGADVSHARALTLLEASPPADRLSESLASTVAAATGTSGFSVLPPDAVVADATPFVIDGDTLAKITQRPPVQGQVRLQITERFTATAAVLLGLMAALLLAVVWRRFRGAALRGGALASVLSALAILPLNQLSNRTRLFDPSVYYSPLGGPLTANAGTLLLAAALVLLALLSLLRSRKPLRSRGLALWLVVALAVLGPFLLRDLARGISPPVWGSSTTLWLALQAALFLSACVVLVAGATAGRALLGRWRGLPPAVPIVLSVVAAAVAPILLEAPGRFPGWYPSLWILSIGALALCRPARGFNITAATVAALGATTLVWASSVRQRVYIAERDITAAGEIDPVASALLERFGRTLAGTPALRSRASLLREYVRSDLSSAHYPLELMAWDSTNALAVRLSLSRITTDPALLIDFVDAARRSELVVQQEVGFIAGAQMLVAAPHPDGWVTTVLVAPRTRIVRDEPFLSLFGLTQLVERDPPYTLTTAEVERGASPPSRAPRWERAGDVLHGDIPLRGAPGDMSAHVDIDLRSYDVLVERGTLILLFDLLLFLVLWSMVIAADGSLGRWMRARRQLWARSYRARLTLALFGFFVIPAVVFAFWSQRSIQSGDRQSRELLLNEMLRAAEGDVAYGRLDGASRQLEAPLFLYESGRLVSSSDSIFLQLAPLGRRLPPRVYSALEIDNEPATSHLLNVGATQALVGYRMVSDPTSRPAVLAAPARADNMAIDRRRRDLGVLVLFTTAVGALAALVLSGIAAQQLARPIGSLRSAALAIARGEQHPSLPDEPRSEFAAVFAAFRSMASDLSSSRQQLVAAQRRTEAILRNVASGVIAFDRQGRIALANPRSSTLLGIKIDTGMVLDDRRLAGLQRYITTFLGTDDYEMEFDQEIGGRQMHGWLTRLSSGDGGAVLTLDDVSELARAQRVIAWGQMARQVAHEIKNPLTPIRLGVQHLRRAHIDKREDFDAILDSNVARILAEIDRLDEIARSFSRYGVVAAPESGTEPIDVGDIARDVLALERMGEGDVRWNYEEGEGSMMALASEDELREVLLNLLENARHAAARSVLMSVQRNAATIQIDVRDDGHGIPEDVLPRIFEPHFSTRSSGSGLGLAISRKIIEGWGGQVAVTSEVGKGTRVTILLVAPREL